MGELEPNLLGEIVSKLCATDQARFHAVCTHWLAAAHPIINNANATSKSFSSSSLPWHGCKYPPGSTVFHVYDPLSSTFFLLVDIASYNILHGQFNFDRLLQDEFVTQNSRSRKFISFVLYGELMITCFNRFVKNDAIPGQQFVKRYDRSRKVWIPVPTLVDYAVFIFGTDIANFSLINTKGRTCNGVLPNKVYRFFLGGCLVYSIEDGQLVQFKSVNSNMLETGGDDLPEYKYNYAIPNTRMTYWLEAPRVRSSSNNQEVRSFRDEGNQGAVLALG